jgi:hypothetical protein
MKLREAVEGDMRGATEDLREVTLRVSGAVGMGRAAELLEGQTGLIGRGRRGVADVLAEDREGLPKCKRLERQDDLSARTVGNVLNQSQVAPQFLFFYKVIGRLQLKN